MATKGEDNIEAHRQVAILDNAWRELFLQGSEEEQGAHSIQDMRHAPRALGYMLSRLIDECVGDINEEVTRLVSTGQMDPDATTHFTFNALYSATVMIGNRMFQMGQRLATELPFANMVPCPCTVLYDEDLDDLLKKAAEEGPQPE